MAKQMKHYSGAITALSLCTVVLVWAHILVAFMTENQLYWFLTLGLLALVLLVLAFIALRYEEKS